MDANDPHSDPHGVDAEELLRRALLNPEASAALALRIDGLALARALTVVFHGRLDLGTIQTFVAPGEFGAGDAVPARALLRVPCDLDLADAPDASSAHDLYAAQARALRDALVAADTVLELWREAIEALADSPVGVDRSIDLSVRLPAPRLMPVALVDPESRLTVVPVCGARTLAEGRPPLGIACAQQDVVHVYPLPDDPQRCLEDFMGRAAEHAHRLAGELDHQEQSVRRFLEISAADEPPGPLL
jgi:hypothetical protein